MIADTHGQDVIDARHRWWQSGAIQQTLRLSASQVLQLDSVFERGLPGRMTLRRKLAQMDRLLQRIVERGNADDARVANLSEQVEALRAQANVQRTMVLFTMYRILTADQRRAFAQIQRAVSQPPTGSGTLDEP